VREGYEAAFEEIVRRYGPALGRYARAIVGGSAEDVTQDALSKALVALRRGDNEIQLRPWLYRIVRNTALNDLRDRPPQTAALSDRVAAPRDVAEEIERREEIDGVIGRLQALPEAQRAAIVMRELEGLGHDEIAAALGVSGGAARQAIHRARTALRDGLGLTIPLPLLRAMLAGGAPAAEMAAGGVGAGVALKAAAATLLVAGAVGAGLVAHQAGHEGRAEAASAGRADGPSAAASTAAELRSATRRNSEAQGGGSRRGEDRKAGRSNGSGDAGDDRGGTREGHGGGDGASADGGRSDDHGGPSGDDGGHSGSSGSSGSDDGGGSSGPDGGDSTPDGGGESNSGPDSGSGDVTTEAESEGSSDSGDGGGLSSPQIQSITEEER